jgi:ATP-binding protein involved in chromosome partitioning
MIKHVLAIGAGKGGVGKSTVAVNLALSLVKKGFKVGLLDADLYGPSIRHMLQEEKLPMQTDENKIMPAIAGGIVYISMDFFLKEEEASILRAPIANSIISQFLEGVVWGDLDYLLIDFPPGTGDIQITLTQQANITAAILVTWPQDLALLDVRKALSHFVKSNIPILGVIENMHGLFPGSAARKLAQQIDASFLFPLAFDPVISISADKRIAQPLEIFDDLASLVVDALRENSAQSKQIEFSLVNSRKLRLEWEDGKVSEISLAELQGACPCARCREYKEGSEEREVFADGIQAVGRYALSVQFTSGCVKGIYPFEMLRKWRTI